MRVRRAVCWTSAGLVLVVALGASAGAARARMEASKLRERQRFAAAHVVLYPKRSANPYVHAAVELAVGGRVRIADLPVDYWRWPLVWHLHREGEPGAEAWLRAWLGKERTEWARIPYGSLNHQLARSGGIYAASSVLGEAAAVRHGGEGARAARTRIEDVLRGQWWDGSGPWEEMRTASAGTHPETTRSRHYGVRNFTYLWALADLANEDVAARAAEELDLACDLLLAGLRPDGLWDEARLPRFRPDKDAIVLPEQWKPMGLTAHPGQSPVVSYVLFAHVPWRSELQGHARKGEDERHEQWSDYLFLGGRRWRPPSSGTAAPSAPR